MTADPRIVLACTTCELTVEQAAQDDEAVRGALASFFVVHAEHRTWIDVSGAATGLPRPHVAEVDQPAIERRSR